MTAKNTPTRNRGGSRKLADFDLMDGATPATSPAVAALQVESAAVPAVVPAPAAAPTTVVTPAAATPAPAAAEPPADATPAEKLSFYERIVHDAQTAHAAAARAADARFLNAAGPSLRAIHEQGLYLELAGPGGQPYSTFQDYLQDRWNLSRAAGYRILNAEPVREALAPITDVQPSTRQVGVLYPVWKDFGAEQVREVWQKAEAAGKTSPDELRKARDLLGYSKSPELAAPPSSTPSTALARVDKALTRVDANAALLLAKENPERAKEVAAHLKELVAILEM
ncbi:hypothetical protein [Actinacidiphila sp. bgisy160]|uniref:hypothetical protein n=1 Tax=Actinacidiphila sp. bgisy160 TaxID=3413796 RepID=UPI003D75821A